MSLSEQQVHEALRTVVDPELHVNILDLGLIYGVGIDELDDGSFQYSFDLPPSLSTYVVEKGSIAVDGISLTVAGVDATSFSIAVIPLTHAVTTLGSQGAAEHQHRQWVVIRESRSLAERIDRRFVPTEVLVARALDEIAFVPHRRQSDGANTCVACGTIVFHLDRKTSVLDPDRRIALHAV